MAASRPRLSPPTSRPLNPDGMGDQQVDVSAFSSPDAAIIQVAVQEPTVGGGAQVRRYEVSADARMNRPGSAASNRPVRGASAVMDMRGRLAVSRE